MTHAQRVELIRPGVPSAAGQVWADLGAGSGAFTLALLELLGEKGQVYAVDKNLRQPKNGQIHPLWGDFTKPLKLPLLDGILMANSLHYVEDKAALIRQLVTYFKPSGQLLVVEYAGRKPNPWVPFPVAFSGLEEIAFQTGLSIHEIGKTPSDFGGEIYAAALTRR